MKEGIGAVAGRHFGANAGCQCYCGRSPPAHPQGWLRKGANAFAPFATAVASQQEVQTALAEPPTRMCQFVQLLTNFVIIAGPRLVANDRPVRSNYRAR